MHTCLWPDARAALGKAVLLATLCRPSSLSFLLMWATVWCGGTPQTKPEAQLGNHCSRPLAAFSSTLFPLWFWSTHLAYTTSAEGLEIVSLEKKPFSDPPLWVDLGSQLLGCVWVRVALKNHVTRTPFCLPALLLRGPKQWPTVCGHEKEGGHQAQSNGHSLLF